MADFTRAELRKIFQAAEIEVPKDVLGQLCDLHTNSNEEISEALKTANGKLEEAERERDALKLKVPKDNEETVPKKDYDKLKSDFDAYKSEVSTKTTRDKKEKAAREILKEAGIPEKRRDAILKVFDVDGIEFNADGKVKDAEKRVESVKTEWADFIPTVERVGADIADPPSNKGDKKTKEDIMAIKDRTERRSEIAQHMDLFQ